MARTPSRERLAEFQVYLDFFRWMWAFEETLGPGLTPQATPRGTSYADLAVAAVQKMLTEGTAPFSEILTGVKQAVADQLEMTRDFLQDAVKRADDFLIAEGAVTLTEMRRRVWRVIPKVLNRGRIRSIDEFYVVKNVLDDDGENLPEKDRARLERMRFDFEMHAKPSRPAATDPRPRAAGPTRPNPKTHRH